MNFYEDLTQIAKTALNYYGIEFTDLAEDRRIVERWVNVRLKLIKPEPRQIQKSPKFFSASFDAETSSILAEIEKNIIHGEDINPYLSTRIFCKDYTDFLFYDWGIYHLHLSTTSSGGYFMARSNWLLFIKIHKNTAYFIDVLRHNEKHVFAQKELLKTIQRNWPEILDEHKLEGVTNIRSEVEDPDQIVEMRKAGINVCHKIGGSVYGLIGGGITSASTGSNVITETDKLYHMAERAMEHAKEIMRSSSVKSFDFYLGFHPEEGFRIVDRNSDCKIPIRL